MRNGQEQSQMSSTGKHTGYNMPKNEMSIEGASQRSGPAVALQVLHVVSKG